MRTTKENKMKKLLAILVVALAIPTMGFAGGEGRYQGVSTNSKATFIFVVDTKTGKVRKCDKRACTKIPDE